MHGDFGNVHCRHGMLICNGGYRAPTGDIDHKPMVTFSQDYMKTFTSKSFAIGKDGRSAIQPELSVEEVEAGLFRLHVRTTNFSDHPVFCKVVVETETTFNPSRYLIPCVMYNGNEYGTRNSPKGLTYEGEPWIFAYDRSGIPSCTVSEDESHVLGMFASDDSEASLRSACSLVKTLRGTFLHRIIYPVTEAPVTYSGKNEMGERYEEWLELPPGATFQASCWVCEDVPPWTNYGFVPVFERAWCVLKHELSPCLTFDELWKYGMSFSSAMRITIDGKEFFSGAFGDVTHAIGNHIRRADVDPQLTLRDIEEHPQLNRFTLTQSSGIGFTSQCFMNCRIQIADALRGECNDEQLQYAQRVMDNWLDYQAPNGLIFRPGQERTDCCHMGWSMIEMARISQLLGTHGMDGRRYLDCARKTADFFIAKYSPDAGFGKQWDREGTCTDTGGSVGGFVLLGLVTVWKMAHDPRYLEAIRKAIDFYFERDLNHFVCNAGAIDCLCVDKESAYPFFESSLELYQATGEDLYLEYALKAAYYICSWLFCYDAVYDDDSEFSHIGYHTAGGTAISAEHHAIDPFGAIIVPDFLLLGRITGDEKWKHIGRLIWSNATQAIATDEEQLWHGIKRPLGGQNEGFFQTRWTKYRSDPNRRGHYNDYLGVWLTTFRLSAILAMREKGLDVELK